MPRSITTTKPTTMNEAELAKAWLKARPRATPATLQELERAGFELLEVNNTPVLAHRHDHATILAAIEAAETTTNNIAADLLELRRQRDDLQAELDACRMTLGGGLDGIAAIQDKLAEVQAERDDLAKAKDEAARLRAAIETPVTGLQGRLAALADQVRILKEENTGLQKDAHFLTTDLKHAREAHARARTAQAVPTDDQGPPVRIANLSTPQPDTKGQAGRQAYEARIQGARWSDMPQGSIQYARAYARRRGLPWPPAPEA